MGVGYSGNIREPTWCSGSTLAQNARDVGSSPTLGTVFHIFVTSTTLVTRTMIQDPVQATRCMVVELTLCMYIACMYVMVSIKRLTILGERVY